MFGLGEPVDRIIIIRKRDVLSHDDVNPIYIKSVEQIHMVCGTPLGKLVAIPTNHDLL